MAGAWTGALACGVMVVWAKGPTRQAQQHRLAFTLAHIAL